MIGMQYRITLPSDYNMEIIKKRVEENGFKTDGFKDLLFKCYLIQEKDKNGFENVYAPLYLWKDSEGMNDFIFNGYYDNILNSFGWQTINIGVPLKIELSKNFMNAKYVVEINKEIKPSSSLSGYKDSLEHSYQKDSGLCGNTCIYNPDKWRYSQFLFFEKRPETNENNIYQILHISKG